MILSPDGHCRTFDARAQGTVPGEGVAVVLLKRAEDAIAKAKLEKDPIAGEIKVTRTRYGIPRSTKVKPDEEAALVEAVKGANAQMNASKYGEAEKTLAAADKTLPLDVLAKVDAISREIRYPMG